jgi:hypothetical protein
MGITKDVAGLLPLRFEANAALLLREPLSALNCLPDVFHSIFHA